MSSQQDNEIQDLEASDSAVELSTESEAVTSHKKRKVWSWVKGIVHVLAYGSLLLVLAYFLVGPDLVKRVLLSQIRQAGILGVDLDEADLRFGALHLRGLVGREGRLSAESIKVSFDQESLQKTAVKRIEVYGLRWQLRIRDGVMDLGLPEGLLDTDRSKNENQEKDEALPFTELLLRESVILLDYEGLNFRIPVTGTIVQTEDQQLEVNLLLIPMNAPMKLTGQIDPASGEVKLDLEPGQLFDPHRKDLAGYWAKLLSSLRFDFDASFEIKDGENIIKAQVSYEPDTLSLPMAGADIDLEKPVVSLDFEMVDQEIRQANLILEAETGHINGMKLIAPSMRMVGDHQQTQVVIQAGQPDRLDLNITGLLPAPSDFIAEPMKWEMPFEWRLFGQVPQTWASYLSFQQWQVDSAFNVESVGEAVLHVNLADRVFNSDASQKLESTWRVDWQELGLKLDSLSLSHLMERWQIQRVSSELILGGQMSAEGAQLRLLQPAKMVIGGVDDEKETPTLLAKSNPVISKPHELISLKLDHQESKLNFDWSFQSVDLAFPQLVLKVNPSNWIAFGSVAMGVKAELSTSITLKNELLSAQRTRADFSMDKLGLKLGEFEPIYDQPVIQLRSSNPLTWNLVESSLESSFDLKWIKPQMTWPGWKVTGDSLQWKGKFALVKGRPLRLNSLIELKKGELVSEDLGLRFKGITLSAPMLQDLEIGDNKGSLFINEMARGHVLYPPIFGEFYWQDLQMFSSATSRLSESIEVQAKGLINLQDGFAMDLQAKVPQTSLDDPAMLSSLLPELRGFGLTGTMAMEGRLQILKGEMTPYLKLDIKEGALVNVKEKTELEGIEGQLVINGLSPLTTPGRQEFKLARASYGGFELVNGSLRFRLEDWNRVEVERTKWDLPHGGKVFIHSFQFNVEDPVIDVELFLERMDLVKWIQEASGEMVTGSAKMNGRIPLKFKDGKVQLAGAGFLYSTPGEGVIRINDQKMLDLLMVYVNVALQQVEFGRRVAELFEEAMRDLELNRMVIELDEQTEGGRASIWVSGKGKKEPFTEIGQLELNIKPIQDTLDEILKLNLKRQQIDGALDDLFKKVAIE